MKIALVNMPFADICRPSIALSQLKTVVNEQFADVVVDEFYVNFDIAELLGNEVYDFISVSGPSNVAGFGDWFFRQEAFPELKDNTKEYFDRYGPFLGEEAVQVYQQVIRHKRNALGDFLEQLIDKYRLHTYEVVGFTSMFMQNVPSFALARRIKQRNPDSIIVMGGANCESPMGEELVQIIPYVDYVFSGSALKSFPVFVSNFINGQPQKCDSINGVFSKRNTAPMPEITDAGALKPVGPVGEERPIQEVVPVNFDRFLDEYEQKFSNQWKKPYLLFETSRGCWWGAKAHCTFCGLNGGNMGYRAIPPAKALDYLNGLFDKYSDRVDHFSCVDNIVPREYLTDVFPQLRVPENVTMFYEVKADLTESDMKILSDAHVVQIQPGIESLSTPVLKLMRKGTTSFGNIKFLKNCMTYGIEPNWNLLVGFPNELEETFVKYINDLPNLYHLPPPSGTFPVRFDRYSPYFMKDKEYGLDLHPLDYYNFIYPFDKEQLKKIAYYFADHNFNAEYIRNTSKWMDKVRKVVMAWVERWKDKNNVPVLAMSKENGQYVINDTRKGSPAKYRLTEAGKAILLALNTHRSKSALADDLKHLPPEVIEAELSGLIEKGLIFEEKGSLLNLVVVAGNATSVPEANTVRSFQEPELVK